MQNYLLFSSKKIYFCKCQRVDAKKKKENEQTLEELNSAHHHSQAKCQLVQTNYMKRIKVIPLKLFYYQTFFETWRN